MNHPRIRRSFYGLSIFGSLLVAGATISLVTSAQQSPPSPAQTKKAVQTAPLPSAGKQSGLPGNGKLAEAGNDPQKQAQIEMDDSDINEKTGISKGKNFVYTEDDMKVTGLAAVYNKNSKELDAQGSLELDDPKHHLSGDKAHVDRKKQLAVITGNVVITLKPASPAPNTDADSDAAKQKKYPVIITCDRADDSYKKDFLVLNGHLIFKQKIVKDNGKTVERTLTAEHAEYDGKADKLHLFQPVKSYDTDDQKADFTGDVFVGTKEGEETLTSPNRSTIRLNADDVHDDEDTKTDKASTDKQTGEKKQPEKKDTPPPPMPKQPN